MPALMLCLGLAGCSDDGTAVSATEPSTTDSSTTDDSTSTASTTTTEDPTTGVPTTSDTSTGTSTTDDSTTAVTATDATTVVTTEDPSTTGTTVDTTDGTTEGTTDGTTVDTTDGTTVDTTDGTTDGTSTTDDSTSTGPGETCEDGVQNQDETDIDCGGAVCSPCAVGQACMQTSDCLDSGCVGGVCTMVECLADADCDAMDTACNDATCDLNAFACVGAPINEGGPCEDSDLCTATSLCETGACVAGDPVDCTALDGPCSLGACNPGDGQCELSPVNEGMACDDDNNCTDSSSCIAGVCTSPDGPGYVLQEDFSDNSAGWTLSPNWAIGAAVAGCGDPGTDHTDTADNGVAGVVLGGCAPIVPVDANNNFCLTSPAVDTTGLATVNLGFWRDLYSDYAPYMKNKIEVWNGNAWVIVFETFGSPGVNDAAWTKFDYDVTAHSNAALQVRWCYNIGQANAFQRGQWNVDDVLIGEATCNP